MTGPVRPVTNLPEGPCCRGPRSRGRAAHKAHVRVEIATACLLRAGARCPAAVAAIALRMESDRRTQYESDSLHPSMWVWGLSRTKAADVTRLLVAARRVRFDRSLRDVLALSDS